MQRKCETDSSDTAAERDGRLLRGGQLLPPLRRDALEHLLVRELVHQELADSI